MKKIIVLLIILLTLLPAGAKTLTGGVVYTVETAREAAFEGIEYEISMEPFKKYMTDPGFISAAKSEGGRPRVSKKGRRVTYFSGGDYCVIYDDKSLYIFFYDQYGKLYGISIKDKRNDEYPYLSRKYDLKGQLVRVSLVVSGDESYLFTPDKKLTSHWIKDFCYDSEGKIIGSRN